MSLRSLLVALGLLCLFCSSAHSQTTLTLDNTLLTTTVNFYPAPYIDPNSGEITYTGTQSYSITTLGLPGGGYSDVNSLYAVTFSFHPFGSSFVQALTGPESDCDGGGPWTLYQGIAGPIAAPGTYPMSTTIYLQFGGGFPNSAIASGTGNIIVAAAPPSPTPEPISGSLMAIGFAMIALRQRLGRNDVRR